MRILLVCSGNTCRSPMAEALLRRALAESGPEGIAVASAGTGALTGSPASEGAYLVALEAGLDLSGHRARLLSRDLVDGADLILAMSAGHLRRVEALGGAGKATLLADFAGEAGDIPDPFGGDVAEYRETLRHLDRLVEGVRGRLAAGPGERSS